MLRAGLKLTCEHGHPYAEMLEDVQIGEVNWWQTKVRLLSDFDPYGQIEPKCPECGGKLGDWTQLYTEDGLKP